MWTECEIMARDLAALMEEPLPWERLEGKTVLVTGSTGLIGTALVSALTYRALNMENPPKILALARSKEKARKLLGAQMDAYDGLEIVLGDVTALPEITGPVDYIIHAASQTASRAFVQEPVDVITTTLEGTRQLLELCRSKQSSAMVYLSSMEVYGYPPKGTRVNEEQIGALLPTTVRNCYPLSKQMAECLCASYAAQYGVHSRILRLTQTFGPGVAYGDGRVFAQFARCALEGQDIVLKTKGETSRSYLYTMDAVSAILRVLLCGEDGQAYTAANESTYCTIAEMAQMVCHELAGDAIQVRFELEDVTKLGYANTLYMNLDTAKLQALGWQPRCGLPEMYRNMMETMKRPAP